MVIREEYLKKVSDFLDTPLVKVITGMRRVGKSELLKSIQDMLQKNFLVTAEQIILIDKESLLFDDIKTYKDLHLYIQSQLSNALKHYIFIDEIQEIEDWERAVRSYGADGDKYEVFITGSNAKLLSGELSTFLTGRYIEIQVSPLTFREFIQFRKSYDDSGVKTVREYFQEFMKYGGLPGIHGFSLQDEKPVFQYIQSIFDSILFRDVIARYSIRSTGSLRDIFLFLADNIGNIVSVQKIYTMMKAKNIPLSLQTVKEYIEYFENVFLMRKVKRYDLKGRRILEVLEKYYLQDIGMRHFIKGYRGDTGRIIENIVYLELVARGYTVNIGKIYANEIDFVAEKNGTVEYIQVAQTLAESTVRERETRSLLQEKSAHKKYILSLDEIREPTIDTIPHYYLLDWLLDT